MHKFSKAFLISTLMISYSYGRSNRDGDFIDKNVMSESTCKVISNRKSSSNHICSATLISPTELVTSTECIEGKIKYVTCEKKIGNKYIEQKEKVYQILSKDKVLDLAVIKLKKKMKINPMKIASQKDIGHFVNNFNHHNCMVTGYGRDYSDSNEEKNATFVEQLRIQNDLFSFNDTFLKKKGNIEDPEQLIKILSKSKLRNTLLLELMKKDNDGDYLSIDDQELYYELKSKFQEEIEKIKDEYSKHHERKAVRIIKSRKLDFVLMVSAFFPKTRHTSFIRSGDSGGTMSCLNREGEQVLVGVVSSKLSKSINIDDKETGDEGAVIPILFEARDFILGNTFNI